MSKKEKAMKKIIILLFLLEMNTFSNHNLSTDHWSYEALKYVSKKKIITDDIQRFDGTESVSKSEFVYALSKLLKLIEVEKASQEDIRVLEALILQYSDELNKIGFDTKTYDNKLENINDNIHILQELVNENEKKIDVLMKRIEKLEKKKY